VSALSVGVPAPIFQLKLQLVAAHWWWVEEVVLHDAVVASWCMKETLKVVALQQMEGAAAQEASIPVKEGSPLWVEEDVSHGAEGDTL
jgi:hypothetical protein